jgi:hypothetical protein
MRPARIRLFPVGPLVPVPRLTEERCGLVDEIEGRNNRLKFFPLAPNGSGG